MLLTSLKDEICFSGDLCGGLLEGFCVVLHVFHWISEGCFLCSDPVLGELLEKRLVSLVLDIETLEHEVALLKCHHRQQGTPGCHFGRTKRGSYSEKGHVSAFKGLL